VLHQYPSDDALVSLQCSSAAVPLPQAAATAPLVYSAAAGRTAGTPQYGGVRLQLMTCSSQQFVDALASKATLTHTHTPTNTHAHTHTKKHPNPHNQGGHTVQKSKNGHIVPCDAA
jgi:hypothetical protein